MVLAEAKKRCVWLRASIIAFPFLVLSGGVLYSHIMLSLQIAYAEDQVKVILDTLQEAEEGDLAEKRECLKYIQHYYPSGSKQQTGSRLDRMVEACRHYAVNKIEESINGGHDSSSIVAAEPEGDQTEADDESE